MTALLAGGAERRTIVRPPRWFSGGPTLVLILLLRSVDLNAQAGPGNLRVEVSQQTLPADVSRVTSVTIAPDRGIVLSSVSARSVWRISPSGQASEVELDPSMPLPRWIGWVGDTLWIADWLVSEAVLLPAGGAPRRVPSVLPDPPGPVRGAHRLALLPRDRVLVQTSAPLLSLAAADGAIRMADSPEFDQPEPITGLPIWIADDSGNVIETLSVLGPERRALGVTIEARAGGAGRRYFQTVQAPQPFSDAPLTAASADGQYLVTLEQRIEDASRPDFTVRRRDLIGEREDVWTYTYSPVALGDETIEDELHRMAATFSDRGPGEIALLREVLFAPTRLPPIRDLRVGGEGSVWLRRWTPDGAPTQSWRVHDAGGEFLGFVELPPDFVIHDVEGTVAWGTRESDSHGSLWKVSVETGGEGAP